jgi:hypothetical protein
MPEGGRMIENWIGVVRVDPLTDRKNAYFVLPADSEHGTDNPRLFVRCQNSKPDVLLDPDDYLGDRNNRVVLRFGANPPMEQRWLLATNSAALFVPGNAEKVETFVRELASYERLVIQVTPYNEGPKTMVFNLNGITQVNEELWAVCPTTAKK